MLDGVRHWVARLYNTTVYTILFKQEKDRLAKEQEMRGILQQEKEVMMAKLHQVEEENRLCREALVSTAAAIYPVNVLCPFCFEMCTLLLHTVFMWLVIPMLFLTCILSFLSSMSHKCKIILTYQDKVIRTLI